MRPLLALLACLVAFPAFAQPKPVVLGGTEVRDLPVSPSGRHYQLLIGLPATYASNPEKRYPVLYLCDGYYDFVAVRGGTGNLIYDRTAREYILVGISYAGENLNYDQMRSWELTPTAPESDPEKKSFGHAAQFLESIEKEIIPFVEKEYRADPAYRVLGGSSLGGLFTLFAMIERPGLFQAHIVPTPAAWWDNGWLFEREEKFFQNGGQLEGRVFITAGDGEDPNFIAKTPEYAERLKAHHPKLQVKYRLIDDGEGHAGQKPEAYNRGIRFVLPVE